MLLAATGLAQPSPARKTADNLGSAVAAASTNTSMSLRATNVQPHHAMLIDSMGRLVLQPTNQVANPALLPPPSTGLERQIPTPVPGASTPPQVQSRQKASIEGQEEFRFFPSVQPVVGPYLASKDEYGNTAAMPGALIPIVPLESFVQGAKYWLSDEGLRYLLRQTFNAVSMTDVMKGENQLAYYTFDLKAKWTVFSSPADGVAGGLSTQIDAKSGLDAAGQTQDARKNLGAATDPTSIWSSINGVRIPEIAWQQSLHNGEIVVVGGMLNEANYLDGNAYASSGRGQFMNSALINSMVVPLANYNFGLNIQYQPTEHWYGMLGSSAGNGKAGFVPWTDFSWNNWTLVGEGGYVSSDLLGLGPGTYRVQPFVGQVKGGPLQRGVGFNMQQQLGRESPLGWFGRFGTGGHELLSAGSEQVNVGSQIGTGLVLQAPLQHLGLVPRLNNDLMGAGFVWSHLEESTQTIYHPDEYVLESFYTLQLSPLMRLQPDLQVVWDPAHSPSPGPALVAQVQFILTW